MVRGPVSHALDIVARVAVKGLLRVGLSMAIPALVSLRNHGLEIIFASVFHSQITTLVLTRPVTITHCPRLAGYYKELALGIEGCFCDHAYSAYEFL